MANASELSALGARGVHLRVQNENLDIRKYARSMHNLEQLVPTQIGIQLNKQELIELFEMKDLVESQLEAQQIFLRAIGERGIHVAVNRYKDYQLVQIRKYFIPFHGPKRVLPTKEGIALRVEEWHQLCGKLSDVQQLLTGGVI